MAYAGYIVNFDLRLDLADAYHQRPSDCSEITPYTLNRVDNEYPPGQPMRSCRAFFTADIWTWLDEEATRLGVTAERVFGAVMTDQLTTRRVHCPT